jgi:AcrR family transcriptional regulator
MPTSERGARTAERLIDAALHAHNGGGPASVTVPAVLAAGGVSVGSLYHHFGSIDGLVAALYARCTGELLDALVAATTSARTARAGVHALVRAYLEFVAEQPEAARVVHAVSGAAFRPEHAAVVAAARDPRIGLLLDWIHPHVAAGRLADLPDTVLEVLLTGPAAEAARRWLAGAPGLDIAEAARLLPERVWRSVRAA